MKWWIQLTSMIYSMQNAWGSVCDLNRSKKLSLSFPSFSCGGRTIKNRWKIFKPHEMRMLPKDLFSTVFVQQLCSYQRRTKFFCIQNVRGIVSRLMWLKKCISSYPDGGVEPLKTLKRDKIQHEKHCEHEKCFLLEFGWCEILWVGIPDPHYMLINISHEKNRSIFTSKWDRHAYAQRNFILR
jgi:hypothetical protein